MKNHLDIFILK